MNKRPKNLYLNQLAKRIVDEAVGDEPKLINDDKKKAAENKRLNCPDPKQEIKKSKP
ncbi:hypothetical protein [Candidatus Nitrotoga sp. 1052]|uniref:hypothetical protein n=1 Tax=Candidatus Nitrotoga sp. 1052 TaxID=2886964 RepID=UPI001EF43F8C|nr:hypothetical protein [Candidatus Nitrotoga sp. 1052]CAH1088228.1 hypothetical protein NTG1052_660021 [Candidatus Nitrotoga sp. 1052]